MEFFRFDWKADLEPALRGRHPGGFIRAFRAGRTGGPGLSEAFTTWAEQQVWESWRTGLAPVELFTWEAPAHPRGTDPDGRRRVPGGLRLALRRGCTSGHAISGPSNLQLPLAGRRIGFFIGGLLVTWFIMPHILAPVKQPRSSSSGSFGILFTKSEVISWYRIQEMFRFQSFHMYGIIGSAVVLGALGTGRSSAGA